MRRRDIFEMSVAKDDEKGVIIKKKLSLEVALQIPSTLTTPRIGFSLILMKIIKKWHE